jgi:DNA-3-methyladenine glycosylase II
MTYCWMHPKAILFPMRKAISTLKKADPVIGRLIDEIGPCRIRFLEPDFEALVKAIVYQQLSGKVAATIFGRLSAAAANGRLTPETVLSLTPAKMRTLGLSRQKIAYIRDLARLTRSGGLDFETLRTMPDEEVMRRLTQVKGIGVWTVHMFLIFALRRKDVLPTGDLGIRAAIRKAYGLAVLPTPREVEELARNWRPYSTIASWYLWRSLEADANL